MCWLDNTVMVNFFINLAAVVFKIELRNITFINCHHLLHLCYLERKKSVLYCRAVFLGLTSDCNCQKPGGRVLSSSDPSQYICSVLSVKEVQLFLKNLKFTQQLCGSQDRTGRAQSTDLIWDTFFFLDSWRIWWMAVISMKDLKACITHHLSQRLYCFSGSIFILATLSLEAADIWSVFIQRGFAEHTQAFPTSCLLELEQLKTFTLSYISGYLL